MKKALSIFLSFIVLLACASETAIYVAFKINQSAIVQQFCINKMQPEKQCHGKCFLNDRLTENEGGGNDPSPASLFEGNLKINFFSDSFPALTATIRETETSDNFTYHPIVSQLFTHSLLRPPQRA